MRRRPVRMWLEQVLPPPAWLAIAFVFWAAEVAFLGRVFWLVPGLTRDEFEYAVVPWRPYTMLGFAFFYGLYRVRCFHPNLHSDYRNWLAQTPWKHPQPLPLGPVLLAWQDAILIGTVMVIAVSLYGWSGSVLLLELFFFAYFLALIVALATTEERPAMYAMTFGIGAMILTSKSELQYFLWCAFTYAAGWMGLRRSWKRFPWSFDSSILIAGDKSRRSTNKSELGWPFKSLSPEPAPEFLPPVQRAIAISLLAGWLVYAVVTWFVEMAGQRRPVEGPPHGLAALFVVPWFVLARIVACDPATYVPPISLAGRIRTGQWIIPGYDQVFIAPALALSVLAFLPPTLAALHMGLGICNGATVTVAVLITCTLGPSRRRWILTGSHRISPGNFGVRPQQMV
jgi:hypothetical protein